MKRVRFFKRFFALALLSLVGFLGWKVYAGIQRLRLSPLLLAAVKQGDTHAVKRLLAAGADPNARDVPLQKPPTLLDAFKSLLHHKINAEDRPTALMIACGTWQKDVVKLLLDYGADPNARTTFVSPRQFTGTDDFSRYLDSPDSTAIFWIGTSTPYLPMRWKASRSQEFIIPAVGFPSGPRSIRQLLIQHGANINVKLANGQTPLLFDLNNTYSLSEANEEVNFWIVQGADIQARDKDGNNALMLAVEYRVPETVRLLLDRGALPENTRPNARFDSGWTPLMYAAFCHDIPRMKTWLAKGANVNVCSDSGETALLAAADGDCEKASSVEALKFLLDHGANVNAADDSGSTALIRAAGWQKGSASMRLLLDRGANVNAKEYSDRNDHKSALILSAENGNGEGVRLLLDRGAYLNLQDRDGNTALLSVMMDGDPAIVKLLLQRSLIGSHFDINYKNHDGETALILAVASKNADIVKRLLAKGANPNGADASGNTPLTYAQMNSVPQIARLLKQAGAKK